MRSVIIEDNQRLCQAVVKTLDAENGRLEKLVAEMMLETELRREALRTNVVSEPARRELVRRMSSKGLSERRSLKVARMSPARRGIGREDRNFELREKILGLAHRHRRYGVGMMRFSTVPESHGFAGTTWVIILSRASFSVACL